MIHRSHPLLKRFALWTGAVVLLLIGYVAGAPFVAYFGQKLFPPGEPIFQTLYAPLLYVAKVPDAIGHAEFTAYLEWCFRSLDRIFND